MRVRVKKDDKLVNIKLFSNGCLQLTGAKTAEDAASVGLSPISFSPHNRPNNQRTLTSASG
jgi:hypothetical protein